MQASLPSVASPTENMLRIGRKHNLKLRVSEPTGGSSLSREEIMQRSSWIWTAGTTMLAAIMLQAAPAQSRPGAIAERSSATITIRVSVTPRFTVTPATGKTSSAGGRSDAMSIGSNAPDLRTRLVVAGPDWPADDPSADVRAASMRASEDEAILAAGARRATRPTLVLITPD